MAVNIYIVPSIGSGASIEDARRPKYFGPGDLYSGYSKAFIDYGSEPVFMVIVKDISPAHHSELANLPDVTTVPDLQQNVGAQLTTVQNKLASFNIPNQWVTSGMSYGSVCRYVAIFFLITQILTQRLGRPKLFGGGITLATRFNQLPANVRQNLLDLAAELKFSTEGMSGSTTIQVILKNLADQWSQLGIPIGGIVL